MEAKRKRKSSPRGKLRTDSPVPSLEQVLSRGWGVRRAAVDALCLRAISCQFGPKALEAIAAGVAARLNDDDRRVRQSVGPLHLS